MHLFLCADIGTSSLKAALIDSDGVEHGFARIRYTTSPSAVTWAEAFKEAVMTLGRGQGSSQMRISALCISANGPTLVPVTLYGQTLPPLMWYDAPPPLAGCASLFLPHIAAFIKNRPADWEKMERLFSCQEWLSYELGAAPVTVLPNERYTPYYWDDAQCAAVGCDKDRLPPFALMGDIIGKTGGAFSVECGLESGVPIVAGAPDFIMALIGTGVLSEGLVCDRAGTSEGINVCSASVCLPQDLRSPSLRTLPHVADGLYNIGALIPKSGALFDEYRRGTGQEARDYTEHLDVLLKSAGILDEDVEGRRVLLRIASHVKEKVELLRKNGFPLNEMRVSGGQAKNALWNRMKAKIAGLTLAIPEITDGELAGGACLCAAALGEAAGVHEAALRIVRIKERYGNAD